ncbi:MAG: GNAT family N-acetyltransferase [Candidatus Bathyarchaeota archaeon]|uniref:GNAT family N-acetyltransferase n=1 Tax=Candidatus Bathycorpusculum sp. TaxID=2994959 RepID=UPI002838B612|nr:GNAT family N-acetyltransferase [Candidatus Termiticorpusculum sp.]MCL2257293.1 GNAT family N-acetyltransferase [Candidatus Termiticorpusculum sp.]MCL2292571.1 GNAT family N-acetyltransferase [Candidatus Termiticorpusculum sp.]
MSDANNLDNKAFTIKKLSENTDLSQFDCSENDELDLNGFIHNDALSYQREGMGVTHLFYRRDKLVGFVTLAMSAVRKGQTGLRLDNYEKVNYPALWLGRLAVDNTERKKGIGTFLLRYCLEFAVEKANTELGCRFAALVTLKGHRTAFYSKYGFKKVKAYLDKDYEMMCFQLF